MATEIKLPELGEGADSADVVRVLVSPGDQIQANQSVLEVESDKASVEVPASQGGRVAEIRVGEGDTVTVGQVILTLEDDGEDGAAESSNGESSPEEAEASVDSGREADEGSSRSRSSNAGASASGDGRQSFDLPKLGEGADQGDVVNVMVQVGDQISKGQSVIEIESDKASVEVPSEVEGEVVEVKVAVGDTVSVGQTILVVDSTGEGGSAEEAPPRGKSDDAGAEKSTDRESKPESKPSPRPSESAGRPEGGERRPVAAAPSVRTKARALGVDIRAVEGSGPAGRISKEDVERHAARGRRDEAPAESPTSSRPAAADDGAEHREKMSGIRKTIAQRMTESWQTIPHVTLYREVDATELEAVRQRFKGRVAAQGAKLTVTAILVKICAKVLRDFPRANASVDMDALEIVHHADVNIGVAADTDRGLVVPVVRDVPSLGIVDIALRLDELAEKARSGKLSREEMTGATFSLSKLGGLGIGFFTPIINPPEVAILGVGRAQKDARDRLMMPLSLSIDHRVLDGADGARVLKAIAEAVEDPVSMAF